LPSSLLFRTIGPRTYLAGRLFLPPQQQRRQQQFSINIQMDA
jgi:hypothetical protein